MNIFLTAYITIFLAELGDKTQIATLLFASGKGANKLAVFAGSALALASATAIAVMLGGAITSIISEKTLKLLGGIGFVAVGLWTIFHK